MWIEYLEQIPAMSPKKRAEKPVPELGTRKGPRLAYKTGEGKGSGEDPEGGKTGEGKGGQPYFFGIGGSAGSVAETERRPAESLAERLAETGRRLAASVSETERRLAEWKARDAAASGSSGSADDKSIEKEGRSGDDRRKLRDQRQEKNDLSDEDNSKWERAEAGWNEEDQEAVIGAGGNAISKKRPS